jgi:hypothetical protein
MQRGARRFATNVQVMHRPAAGECSAALTERLEALASALGAAGVSPERASGLLARAAAATLDAVALELLLDGDAPLRFGQ